MNIYDGCEQAYKNGQQAALAGNYDIYNRITAGNEKYYSPTDYAYIKGFNSVEKTTKSLLNKCSKNVKD